MSVLWDDDEPTSIGVLSDSEAGRLEAGLKSCLMNPFMNFDVVDFAWEAIWHYAKNIQTPITRHQKLFDVVDHVSATGWSLKTCTKWAGRQYISVIARVPIAVDAKTAPEEAARQILTVWKKKVEHDTEAQGISHSRVCTLLKFENKKFAVHETPLSIKAPETLKWKWTERSLKGFDAVTNLPVYFWNPSGSQLREFFQIPQTLPTFEVDYQRLNFNTFIRRVS